MKNLFIFLLLMLLLAGGGFLANYLLVGKPLHDALVNDNRNKGLDANAHYGYYLNPNELVFNVQSISATNSPADIFRILLQSASQLKDKKFEKVVLQYRGTDKFLLTGEFFNKIGSEYGTQNPVYTMRTFTENVYKLDGSPAFGTWSGGLLGVLTKQMDDFNKFHQQWYINDATATN